MIFQLNQSVQYNQLHVVVRLFYNQLDVALSSSSDKTSNASSIEIAGQVLMKCVFGAEKHPQVDQNDPDVTDHTTAFKKKSYPA